MNFINHIERKAKDSLRFPTISLDKYWHLEQIGNQKRTNKQPMTKKAQWCVLAISQKCHSTTTCTTQSRMKAEWPCLCLKGSRIQKFTSSGKESKRIPPPLSQCLLPLFSQKKWATTFPILYHPSFTSERNNLSPRSVKNLS